jgi:arginyl-tRNA synthetase
MKQQFTSLIEAACKELFVNDITAELTRPEEQFGDYTTNVALQLAKQLEKNPREIAEALAAKLRESLQEQVSEVSVAGPGFINFTLNNKTLIAALESKPTQILAGKVIVAEYSDPNPFKILHAGHVYTTVVGDAIANLMEAAGGEVHRVNYGGDVGLHVGKTMWAILKRLGGEFPEKLQAILGPERSAWMAAAYVEGNTAYDDDEQAKTEIVALNKRVYQLHADNDHDSPFAQIYWTCRQWSYEAFDVFYKRLGTRMEKYYPESEVAELGLNTVKEQIGKVFEESDGAVVFKGEPYGLHTRVFINQQGLPTYEAKEVGLIIKKQADYQFDRSVIITANEQAQYMAVVMKAVEQFLPDLAAASTYISHGMVRLAGGVKMSSRKGNIITATDVLDVTAEANKASSGKDDEQTVLGAIKYAFLKTRIGGDLVYEPRESVSLEGNSGPYLQYAHARARSILRKAENSSGELDKVANLEAGERSLVRKIGEYTEVVDKAVNELMPHHTATYLYELAQTFNRFYEQNRVIGDPREPLRLQLVRRYADTLQAGLGLLGIAAPDKM